MSDPDITDETGREQSENDVEISRRKGFLFNFAAFLLGIFLTFLVLEATFRIVGIFTPPIYQRSPVPGLGFELRPGAVFKIDGRRMRLNNLGFLDGDFPVEKAKGVFRAVCLGDSMTSAVSLPAGDNYVELLEKKMRGASPGGQAEFFNMGLGGYNTMQEWLVYEHKARKFKPDLVIVQFILNDLTYSYPVDTSDRLLSRIKTFLSRKLYTYQFLKYLRLRLGGGFNASQKDFDKLDPKSSPVGPEFMKSVFDPQGPKFLEWKQAVSKFGELNRSGTPVLFVIFPWPIYQGMDKGAPYPYYAFHDQVENVLDEQGLPYVDVTADLTEKADLVEFWVKPSDFHLNSKAHKIIADVLEPKIREIQSGK